MNDAIGMLDVVALTEDVSDRGLVRGQVGIVIIVYSPHANDR